MSKVNYSKMNKKNGDDKMENTIREPIDVVNLTENPEPEESVEETTPTIELTIGRVTNEHAKLNIRQAPDLTAPVLIIIDHSVELLIDQNESTNDFYKVTTPEGIEGYCMKKFVTVTTKKA